MGSNSPSMWSIRRPDTLPAQQHLEHQRVAVLKDRRVFHADGRQVVDVEEAAVIDFVAGRLPMGQAVDLGIEQPVEVVKALRAAGSAVDLGQVRGDELAHGRALRRDLRQPLLDHFLFPLPLGTASTPCSFRSGKWSRAVRMLSNSSKSGESAASDCLSRSRLRARIRG